MSPIGTKELTFLECDLNGSEIVEWSQDADFSYRLLLRWGCFPILLLLMVTISLNTLGEQSGSAILPIILAYNEIGRVILITLLLYTLYVVVRAQRAKYFITSQRLLEVRGSSIRNEIPRRNLQHLASNEHLRYTVSHRQNAQTFYNICITDPSSGTVIRMTSMSEDALDVIRNL
jgi:hypothetical protein